MPGTPQQKRRQSNRLMGNFDAVTLSQICVRKRKGTVKKYPLLIFPDGSGIVAVHIRELERLEIHLENYSIGYSVVGNQLKRLPIGSTMDSENGVFYWQPGPGFVGDYQFVFIKKSKNGEMSKKIVIVICSPGPRNR
jgi:hypothetical protein